MMKMKQIFKIFFVFLILTAFSFTGVQASTDHSFGYTITANGTEDITIYPDQDFNWALTTSSREKVSQFASKSVSISGYHRYATYYLDLNLPEGVTYAGFYRTGTYSSNGGRDDGTYFDTANNRLVIRIYSGGYSYACGPFWFCYDDGYYSATYHVSVNYSSTITQTGTGTVNGEEGEKWIAAVTIDPLPAQHGGYVTVIDRQVTDDNGNVETRLDLGTAAVMASTDYSEMMTVPWSDAETGTGSVSSGDCGLQIVTSALVAPNGDTTWSVEDDSTEVDTWMVENKLFARTAANPATDHSFGYTITANGTEDITIYPAQDFNWALTTSSREWVYQFASKSVSISGYHRYATYYLYPPPGETITYWGRYGVSRSSGGDDVGTYIDTANNRLVIKIYSGGYSYGCGPFTWCYVDGSYSAVYYVSGEYFYTTTQVGTGTVNGEEGEKWIAAVSIDPPPAQHGGYVTVLDRQITDDNGNVETRLDLGTAAVMASTDYSEIVAQPWIGTEAGMAYVGIGDGDKCIVLSSLVAPNGDTTWSVLDDSEEVDTWFTGDRLFARVNNLPPAAEANGPYAGVEGELLSISAAGSTDPDGTIISYEWDLDNDGEFDVASGTPVQYSWADDYAGTILLKVTDEAGASSIDTAEVAVSNAAPLVDAGPGGSIEEGGTFTGSGTFADPGADTWTATVDYGDGSPVEPLALAGNNFSLGHVYADDGLYTMTACVQDDESAEGCDTAEVAVSNVAPVVDAGPDGSIVEGGKFTGSGTFADPGADTWTATVDYGDGSPLEDLALAGKSFYLSHTYADDGLYTVTVCVQDDESAEGCDTVEVTVSNTAPLVDAGPGGSIEEGGVFTGSGMFADPGADTWTATVDYGDGSPVEGLALAGKDFSLSHVYADDGLYTVTVCVQDDESAEGCDTAEVTVSNVAPVVDAGPGGSTVEGETFAGSGSFADPGADTWTATVDYGDGSLVEPLALAGKSFGLSHVYADDGLYTVTVCIQDDEEAEDCDTAEVTVSNVAPLVDAGPGGSIEEGTNFAGSGSFADPGADTWTGTVDYGDGSLVENLALAGKSFSLSHTYADDGFYTVMVCVQDDESAEGCGTAEVTVNNTAPQVEVTGPTSQTVQYSDDIQEVVLSASDITLDTLSIAADLPANLSLSAGACSAENGILTCIWSLTGTVNVPAGAYPIQIEVSDEDGGVTATVITLNVEAEDAVIDFPTDNPVSVKVEAPDGPSGMFALSVELQEKLPDDASYGAHAGDIGLAVVSMILVPVGPGSPVAGLCSPGAVSGTGYDAVVPFTCQFDDVPVNTYTAEVTITGGYYQSAAEDVLVVYDPSLGFTTGGGWFYWPETGERTNFGYTMNYTKKQTSVKGSLLLIRHLPGGTIYRIKSNALYGLALGENSTLQMGWASFSGKITYFEPGMLEPEGGYEFITYVEDLNEPGNGSDRFWLEVYDKNGALVAALSMPRDAIDHAIPIDGGNIVVPHQ